MPERRGLSMTVMRTTKNGWTKEMATNFVLLLLGIDIDKE
jgi:hypothetical protein